LSTKIDLQYPYNQDWKAGYLNINSEGRATVTLYNSASDRSSTQYARYLLAVKMNRYLTSEEEADHIDDDKTNDCLSNLQLLSSKENRNKLNHNKGISMAEFICPVCEKIFSIVKRNSPLVIKSKKAATCSRSCGGKLKSINTTEPIRFIREWKKYLYL
jgi:hypothetical protein